MASFERVVLVSVSSPGGGRGARERRAEGQNNLASELLPSGPSKQHASLPYLGAHCSELRTNSHSAMLSLEWSQLYPKLSFHLYHSPEESAVPL